MPWTGAFWEQWAAPPRSLGQEPGRRSSEGPPSGAIPVPAVARLEFLLRAQARGRTGRERASWGTYNAARGAWRRHYLNLRGVVQALRSLDRGKKPEAGGTGQAL